MAIATRTENRPFYASSEPPILVKLLCFTLTLHPHKKLLFVSEIKVLHNELTNFQFFHWCLHDQLHY